MSEIKSFDINEIIILLVQEQKFMYDKSSYNYKNKTKKTEVWKEIAKEIKSLTGTNVTDKQVKGKWKYLKLRYVNLHRKITAYNSSGSAAKKIDTDFQYFDLMNFLKIYLDHRKTDSSFKRKLTEVDGNNDDTSDDDDIDNDHEDEDKAADEGSDDDVSIHSTSDLPEMSQEKTAKNHKQSIEDDISWEVNKNHANDYLAIIKDVWDQVPKQRRRQCFERIMHNIKHMKKDHN